MAVIRDKYHSLVTVPVAQPTPTAQTAIQQTLIWKLYECIPLPHLDFGSGITSVTLPRSGDLVTNIALSIRLPELPLELKYRNAGIESIIKNATLEIGDTPIYSISGANLAAYYSKTLGCHHHYNTNTNTNGTDATAEHRDVVISLPFANGWGLSVINLVYHEIKVKIELATVNTVYTNKSQDTAAEQSALDLNKLHVDCAELLVTFAHFDMEFRRAMCHSPHQCIIEQFLEYPNTLIKAQQRSVLITLPNANTKCIYWYFTSKNGDILKQQHLIKSVKASCNNAEWAKSRMTATQFKYTQSGQYHNCAECNNSYYLYSFSNDSGLNKCCMTEESINNLRGSEFKTYVRDSGYCAKQINYYNASEFPHNMSLELELIEDIPDGQMHCFAVVYNTLRYESGMAGVGV